MPYYLARILGTGAVALELGQVDDPWRPDLPQPFATAIPTDPDGRPTFGWALCRTPAEVPETANRQRIPSGPLSNLSGKQRNDLAKAIDTKLGLTVDVHPSRTGEDVAADVLAYLSRAGATLGVG